MLLHQGAADVVTAPAQGFRGSVETEFDPARLVVGDPVAEVDAGDGRQVEGGFEYGLIAAYPFAHGFGGLLADEGQEDEFADAGMVVLDRLLLDLTELVEMIDLLGRGFDMAAEHGAGCGEAALVGGSYDFTPGGGVDFLRADDLANAIVQNLRRCSRQGPNTCISEGFDRGFER